MNLKYILCVLFFWICFLIASFSLLYVFLFFTKMLKMFDLLKILLIGLYNTHTKFVDIIELLKMVIVFNDC